MVLAAMSLCVAGCGYRPLYASRDAGGAAVASDLSAVTIPEAQSRIEQQVRNSLLLSLGSSAGGGTYTLALSAKSSTGSVVASPSPGMYRYNYALTVNYRLLETSSGEVLTSGTSKSLVAYDQFKQPVASMTTSADAESRAAKDVAEDIRMRLAAFFATRTATQ